MAEHIVGKTSDIGEGAGKTFTIEGQTIAVFNKGEEFFAIEDTCKHKGGSLGEGKLDGGHNYLSFGMVGNTILQMGNV